MELSASIAGSGRNISDTPVSPGLYTLIILHNRRVARSSRSQIESLELTVIFSGKDWFYKLVFWSWDEMVGCTTAASALGQALPNPWTVASRGADPMNANSSQTRDVLKNRFCNLQNRFFNTSAIWTSRRVCYPLPRVERDRTGPKQVSRAGGRPCNRSSQPEPLFSFDFACFFSIIDEKI